MPSFETSINYYAQLRIEAPSSAGQIKKAYHKLALRYHPDKTNGDEARQEKLKAILTAYEILGDAETKVAYDLARLYISVVEDEEDFMFSEDETMAGTASSSTTTSSSSSSSSSAQSTGTEDTFYTPPSTPDAEPESFASPPPPKPNPRFETFWTSSYEMTTYYKNIMLARDLAVDRHKAAVKAEAAATVDKSVSFEEWEIVYNCLLMREMDREENERAWTNARRTANQLKAKHKEEQARVRKADKARMKKGKASTGAY